MTTLRHTPLGIPWVMDVMVALTERDDAMRFNEMIEAVPEMPRTGLSQVIASLLEAGLLERHRYSERPLRYEYHLTLEGYGVGNYLTMIKKALGKAGT